MASRCDRVKPTHYPRLPFHILRSVQVLSSTVVTSVMFYFLSALAQDNIKLPWTFILLMAVALLTLVSLAISIVLHCCHGLKPTLNMVMNSGLALLWAVAFSLLSWWSSGTLSHVCNEDNWDDEVGVSVCRFYKALFSFSLFGLLSTILALILDAYVQRQALVRGKFQAIGMVAGDGKTAWSHVLESNPNASASKQQGRGGEGYYLPEEQFAYGEDIGYHGAAGQAERRSLERRV